MTLTLNTFIKQKGFATTGGQAKLFIRSGAVKVNSQTTTVNKLQLKAGDVVTVHNTNFVVE